jgi:hypothetical protein
MFEEERTRSGSDEKGSVESASGPESVGPVEGQDARDGWPERVEAGPQPAWGKVAASDREAGQPAGTRPSGSEADDFQEYPALGPSG